VLEAVNRRWQHQSVARYRFQSSVYRVLFLRIDLIDTQMSNASSLFVIRHNLSAFVIPWAQRVRDLWQTDKMWAYISRHLLRLWYSLVTDERMRMDHCWDDPGRQKPQHWERKPSGFAAVPTAVDTMACLGLRLGCLDERPPTVQLSQGTDICHTYFCSIVAHILYFCSLNIQCR
jgi:hypothetical protein